MRRDLVVAVLISALCVMLAVPALAADRVIRSGIDLATTRADGNTHYDFKKTPIPAGFFCANSAPFDGLLVLKGSPIATATPRALGNTDVIVQRLDDAVFDKRGVATTRIQFRALSLESVAPVKTSCGEFTAKVSLAGDQPITRLRIIRERANGGRYLAPLAINVKMAFTPVNNPQARPLVLRRNLRFQPNPNASWTHTPPAGAVTHEDFVKVDTDGDGTPDSFLEGTSSNFFAAGDRGIVPTKAEEIITCVCHDDECSVLHCVIDAT